MNALHTVLLCLVIGTAFCVNFRWNTVTSKGGPLRGTNVEAFISNDGDIHLFWKSENYTDNALVYQRMMSDGTVIREDLVADGLERDVNELNPAQVSDSGTHLIVVYRKDSKLEAGIQLLVKESFDGGKSWKKDKVVDKGLNKLDTVYTVLLEQDTERVHVFFIKNGGIYGTPCNTFSCRQGSGCVCI